MKSLTPERCVYENKRRRCAEKQDYDRVISESCVIRDVHGKVAAAYFPAPGDMSAVRRQISTLKEMPFRTTPLLVGDNPKRVRRSLFSDERKIIQKAGAIITEQLDLGDLLRFCVLIRDCPTPYHKDQLARADGLQFRNLVTLLLSFKDRSRGGYTVLPEYRTAFDMSDGMMLLFRGRDLFHSVTTIENDPGGHRTMLVFYADEAIFEKFAFLWE